MSIEEIQEIQEIQIEAYSLFEFCQKVQENILNGFKFDFESNARFPTAFGTLLVCGMVKYPEEDKVQAEEAKEEPKEEVKKVGRKTKVVQE